jgi:beta-glucosidase
MPITAPRSPGQIPVYQGQKAGNSYYSRKTKGVLSRYSEGVTEPLYYFGEGQSYTQFEYSDLKLSEKVSSGGVVEITCTVKNTGKRDGEEVVQLYVSDELAAMLRPYKEFAGAKRIPLKAGESRRVRFTLRPSQFAFLNQDMKWIVEEGDMIVRIGASSEDIRLTGIFHIEDSAEIEGSKRAFYAQADYMPV